MALEPSPRGVLSEDTTAAAEALQIAIWRSLSTVQIADLINGASRAVRTMAMAGLRERHPSATPAELIARYARLTLGADLAIRAYPELARLDP